MALNGGPSFSLCAGDFAALADMLADKEQKKTGAVVDAMPQMTSTV